MEFYAVKMLKYLVLTILKTFVYVAQLMMSGKDQKLKLNELMMDVNRKNSF